VTATVSDQLLDLDPEFLIIYCLLHIKCVKNKQGYNVTIFISSAKGLIRFASVYNGTVVKGLVGSSVNFSWGFSGNVGDINWGLKGGINNFIINGKLVILHANGASTLSGPLEYAGRVSGSRSSGQAIFTLSSITKTYERVYGCRLDPGIGSFDSTEFDFVRLVVEGEKICFLVFYPPYRLCKALVRFCCCLE